MEHSTDLHIRELLGEGGPGGTPLLSFDDDELNTSCPTEVSRRPLSPASRLGRTNSAGRLGDHEEAEEGQHEATKA
jgi:hypothetical protein